MKRTSIICTLGPASNTHATISALAHAGMNVARINMSHGTHESLTEIINNVVKVRNEIDKPIALMLDTKGPEIRIKTFKTGTATLKKGQTFTFTIREIEGDDKIVSLAYKTLITEVKVGDKIYANNGMLVLKVTMLNQTDIVCKVLFGGVLTNRKGLNIPFVVPKGPFLSQQDMDDLVFAIKSGADYIAASFVSSANDVKEMREFLNANGGGGIKIISKIENNDGVKNIKEILNASEGIMVARGDLGIEIPLEKVPSIQKRLVKAANECGKISIIATEMLESMTTSVRPTRAEVSDVANGVYEMATATMLSGETAVGKHPVEVVKTMSKIIIEAEHNIEYDKIFETRASNTFSITNAISETTCSNAIHLRAKLIIVFTNSGYTATMVSSHRIHTPILAVSPNKKVINSLALSWNTFAKHIPEYSTETDMVKEARKFALDSGFVREGDLVIVVTGTPKESGETNMMKVIKV